MLGFEERGNRSTAEKIPRCRVENQRNQPTYDAESGNRTRVTLVEGECSHHCTITVDRRTLAKARHLVDLCLWAARWLATGERTAEKTDSWAGFKPSTSVTPVRCCTHRATRTPGDPGPVSRNPRNSRNLTGDFPVSQFPLYLKN